MSWRWYGLLDPNVLEMNEVDETINWDNYTVFWEMTQYVTRLTWHLLKSISHTNYIYVKQDYEKKGALSP
jgi:hypothetical protein